MSYDPESHISAETDLSYETAGVEEILDGQPWETEDLSGGFNRSIRTYVAPLLDGATVSIQEIKGPKNHKYMITKEGLGEITTWGWFSDIEEMRWVVGKKLVYLSEDANPHLKSIRFSRNGFLADDLENLTRALNDASNYKETEQPIEEIEKDEFDSVQESEADLKIRAAVHDLDASTLFRNSLATGGEIDMEYYVMVMARTAERYGISYEDAQKALELTLEEEEAQWHGQA